MVFFTNDFTFSETIAQITLMSLHGSLTLFRAKIKKIFVKAT